MSFVGQPYWRWGLGGGRWKLQNGRATARVCDGDAIPQGLDEQVGSKIKIPVLLGIGGPQVTEALLTRAYVEDGGVYVEIKLAP